jgi:hypothetical protein
VIISGRQGQDAGRGTLARSKEAYHVLERYMQPKAMCARLPWWYTRLVHRDHGARCNVDVSYRSRKLQKLCASSSAMSRELGSATAAKLAQRVMELVAVDSLADLALLPGPRCHEEADREGQLSLDLVHPRRLIIEPADDPLPLKPDGGLDWTRVSAVVVVEIADTH